MIMDFHFLFKMIEAKFGFRKGVHFVQKECTLCFIEIHFR